MLINYSGSERRSASLSPLVSLCGGAISVGRRWVKLQWRDTLAREEAKWRRGCVVERVTKVEMIFF
jgi:hypothetical protein